MILKEGQRIIDKNGQDKYEVIKLLGSGQFAEVYEVEDVSQETRQDNSQNDPSHKKGKNSGRRYALKIDKMEKDKGEKGDKNPGPFRNEIQFCKKLREQCKKDEALRDAVCDLIEDAILDDRIYIVMDLGGKNLHEVSKCSNIELSMDQIVDIGAKILNTIKAFHKGGFVHRDIKPANFVQIPPQSQDLKQISWKLVDFGLARSYRDDKAQHCQERDMSQGGFRGSISYASVNAHHFKDQSRRDDIWSWWYMLVELLEGDLPWRKDRPKQEEDYRSSALKLKQENMENPEKLFTNRDVMKIMCDMMNHIKRLEFQDGPDYGLLQQKVESLRKCELRRPPNRSRSHKSEGSQQQLSRNSDKGKSRSMDEQQSLSKHNDKIENANIQDIEKEANGKVALQTKISQDLSDMQLSPESKGTSDNLKNQHIGTESNQVSTPGHVQQTQQLQQQQQSVPNAINQQTPSSEQFQTHMHAHGRHSSASVPQQQQRFEGGDRYQVKRERDFDPSFHQHSNKYQKHGDGSHQDDGMYRSSAGSMYSKDRRMHDDRRSRWDSHSHPHHHGHDGSRFHRGQQEDRNMQRKPGAQNDHIPAVFETNNHDAKYKRQRVEDDYNSRHRNKTVSPTKQYPSMKTSPMVNQQFQSSQFSQLVDAYKHGQLSNGVSKAVENMSQLKPMEAMAAIGAVIDGMTHLQPSKLHKVSKVLDALSQYTKEAADKSRQRFEQAPAKNMWP